MRRILVLTILLGGCCTSSRHFEQTPTQGIAFDVRTGQLCKSGPVPNTDGPGTSELPKLDPAEVVQRRDTMPYCMDIAKKF
jgi:hypothetical protein